MRSRRTRALCPVCGEEVLVVARTTQFWFSTVENGRVVPSSLLETDYDSIQVLHFHCDECLEDFDDEDQLRIVEEEPVAWRVDQELDQDMEDDE